MKRRVKSKVMNKSKMPNFIQGMYATIIGVSFFKIDSKALQWQSAKSYDEVITILSNSELTLTFSITALRLLLFIFTLLITAHDWYVYHNDSALCEQEQEKFVNYIPQIFSIFFLALMFTAIENLNLKSWFLFFLFYSLSNIIDLWLYFNKPPKKAKLIKYLLHVTIAVSLYLLVPNELIIGDYVLIMFITMFSIFLLWFLPTDF